MSNTYKPISTKRSDFTIVDTTVANEEKIHAVQVLFPRISIEDRKDICDLHAWKYEEKIPELSHDHRVSVSALGVMLKRTDPASNNKKDSLREELKQLVDRLKVAALAGVKNLTPTEYWYELSKVLFLSFECPESERPNLDFKEIERARTDFFG